MLETLYNRTKQPVIFCDQLITLSCDSQRVSLGINSVSVYSMARVLFLLQEI